MPQPFPFRGYNLFGMSGKKDSRGRSGRQSVPPLSREEVLRQYEFLLNISDAYLSMIGRDYTYLITNDAFCRAIEMQKDEVIGQTPMRVWGKETFQKIIKPYLEESFRSKEIRYTRWFEVPGKGERFFEVTFRPHLDSQGKVDFVLVSSRDLTEQERTRQALQRREEDMEFLSMVNRLYSEGRSLKEITTLVLRSLVRLFDAFASNIFLRDELKKGLHPPRFIYPEELVRMMGQKEDNDLFNAEIRNTSYFEQVMANDRIVQIDSKKRIIRLVDRLLNDSPEKQTMLRMLDERNIGTMLVMPLSRKEERIGVLAIARERPFSPEEQERLRRLGSQMIVVLKRKREEQMMAEQAERIRLLFETSEDAIFLVGKEGVVDCNPAAVRMFEAENKERLLGIDPLELLADEQLDGRKALDTAQETFEKVMRGELVTLEVLHRTMKGKEFYAEVKLNRLSIKGEHYIQSVVRNIDAEKRTRILLEENESSLREAQRIARLGDWFWDLESGKVRWSKEFYRILEYDERHTAPSLHYLLLRIHPDDRPAMVEKIRTVTQQCRKCSDQYRLQMPDGRIKYIGSSGELETKKGKPVKWHGTIHDITSLKIVEQALRESEERFRTIFHEGFYAMCVLRPEGRIEEVNKAFRTLLGYSPRYLKGRSLTALVAPETAPEIQEMLHRLFSGDIKVFSGEITYRQKGGGKIVAQTGLTALHKKGDKTVSIVAMLMDITARKKAEMRILRQAHELSLINRLNMELNKGTSLEEIIRIFDALIKEQYPIDHLLVYLREPFEKDLHLTFSTFPPEKRRELERYTDLSLFRTIPVDRFMELTVRLRSKDQVLLINKEKELDHCMKLFFSGQKHAEQATYLRRLGRINSFIIYPIKQGDHVLGFINLNSEEILDKSIMKDLSGILEQAVMVFLKKIGEMELERLYNAIEKLSEVLIISDPQGRILYINRAIQDLLGYEKETLLGQHLSYFRHPEEDPSFYDNIWKTVNQGKMWVGIHQLLRKDGQTVRTRTGITPIPDEGGGVRYFVTILRDITKELAMEQYLQRTQKLEMMGRFAGGVAHDFNNMLATVMGYVEMVMDEVEPGSLAHRYLEKAKDSGMKAREVIQQLLTFNRGVEPEKEQVVLASIVRETLSLLGPQIPSHVRVRLEDRSGGVVVEADPAQMRQVFLNLLSNAVYALHKKKDGEISVVIDTIQTNASNAFRYPELREGRWLRIRIRDNGQGIPPRLLDRVFDPFFTTKPVGEGSGMGLSVVHGIVENHKGVVRIHSEPGKGTEITIFLPL